MIEFRFLNGKDASRLTTGAMVQAANPDGPSAPVAHSDGSVPDAGTMKVTHLTDPTRFSDFVKSASETAIRHEILRLQQQHKRLDHHIFQMGESQAADELTLRRTKKQKLQLKDLIVALQMQLVPDIPA